MRIGDIKFEVGPVSFCLQYLAPMNDQGVCIQVVGRVKGKETELLRFECLSQRPAYYYSPEVINERWELDQTVAGNPIRWTVKQLRTSLPAMLKKAGYGALAKRVEGTNVALAVDQVEEAAWDLARTKRREVVHNRGDLVVEAGNIKFGLEFRNIERAKIKGMAIHVLSDVAGQEIELLAFDCFEPGGFPAHYHYGPRNEDVQVVMDPVVAPDPLRWVLDQFKGGKLPAMIHRAGYPSVAARLDEELISATLEKEVEPQALAIRAANVK